MEDAKSNTNTSQSLIDAMLKRLKEGLNAEARKKNAPRRYRKAEALAEGDEDTFAKMEEEDEEDD